MKSQLRLFEPTLLAIRDCEELKGSFELFVEVSDIRFEDKRKLVSNIRQCQSLTKLYRLFYNSLLKFEGQGVLV